MTKLIGAVALMLGAVALYLAWAWTHALQPGADTYVVKPGTGVRALANELERRGVIAESKSFVLLAYLTLRTRVIKPGEYRFRAGIDARQILSQVAAGRVVEYPLRVIEGWTFEQMRRELARAPQLTQTLQGMTAAQIMQRLGAPNVHPEGRFFPDTYYYAKGTTDFEILQRAYDKMHTRLRREWENRDSDLPLASADEALILASIVEKETGRADERRLIAGVFVNRLRKGMRLQTDPTVIYGLGSTFDGNLRKIHLLTDNAYNTYTRRGLPPTPIALPGGDSLYAALHPENTDAVFFVSRGDGSHEFSVTLDEHNRAVERYQLRGRSRKP